MDHSQDSLAKPKNVRMANRHHPPQEMVSWHLAGKERERALLLCGWANIRFSSFLSSAVPGQSAASGISNESDDNCRARVRN